jgi:hypothetical protein
MCSRPDSQPRERIKTHAVNPIRVGGINKPDRMPPYRRSVLQLAIEIMADFASMLPATLANDL